MKSSLVVQHNRRSAWGNPLKQIALTLTPGIVSLCVTLSVTNYIDSHAELDVVTSREASPSSSTESLTNSAANFDQAHIALLSEIIEDTIPSHPLKDTIASVIVAESRKANIDPLFVAAVVHTESTFKTRAVSHRGARGLMQIMPTTGRYIAKALNLKFTDSSELQNPETNIRLGVWYLKHLFEKFKGDREQALVAYNWGPTNVARAISSGSSYPETSRTYARKVLGQHDSWSVRLSQYALNKPAALLG